jgi:hypothetical protein
LSGLAVIADRPLTVKVLLWPGFILEGLNEHVAPDEQDREMLETKPLVAEAETVKVVDLVPTTMTLEGLVTESVKGEPPVPEIETVCGLPAASSVMLSEPVLDPLAVGVNVTLTTQLPPGLRTFGSVPQLFVWAKAPVTLMPLRVTATWLLLTTWTVCAALVEPIATVGKTSFLGVKFSVPPPPETPFPVTVILWGLPAALSVIVT